MLLLNGSHASHAQVVTHESETISSPWNSQLVFNPTPIRQLLDPDDLKLAPEDTPVKDRVQPGYEPVGIRAGTWMLSPSLTAGGFYDSNVFSSNTVKRADVAAVFEPTLRARSLWEQNALELELGARSFFYRENPGLNQTDATFKARGRADVTRDLAILTSVQASHLNEGVGSLTSPAGAVRPTPYDLLSGDVTVRQQFNRLTAAVGTRVDSYDFGSTQTQNGTLIDQSARDGQVYTLHGRTDYALSPMLGLFAASDVNRRDLRGTPDQPLDSQGYRVLAGINTEFTRIITGEFGAGVMRQQFASPLIGTIEGPAYRAIVNWSPSRVIDVHFKAEQIVTEATDTTSTGILANAYQIGLDYEFRRNIILSSWGTFEKDDFFGQPRRDKVHMLESSIKYMMNRWSSVSVWHRFIQRDSNTPAFTYDKHQIGINATARF